MRIAIVSDTHANLPNTLSAVRMMSSLDVHVVIHCGDIGSNEIVPLFKHWPTHFVFGNVDHDEKILREEIERAGQTCHDRFGELNLAGKKIAFLHSDDERLFHEVTRGGEYDLVCYGHTHVAKQEKIGRTLVLNPGALYRARPHTFAIVDLPSLEVTSITI